MDKKVSVPAFNWFIYERTQRPQIVLYRPVKRFSALFSRSDSLRCGSTVKLNYAQGRKNNWGNGLAIWIDKAEKPETEIKEEKKEKEYELH